MSLLNLFLVFYGYLSLSFGWLFYIVVFTSFAVAIYTLLRLKDLYKTAEVFIKTITLLGITDLILSGGIATLLTLKWAVKNIV